MSATVTFVAARHRDVGDLSGTYGDTLRRHGFTVGTDAVVERTDRVPASPHVAVVRLRDNDVDVRALRSRAREDLVILAAVDGRPEDVVRVLESGADDCFFHPVAPRELVARIRAQLRRRRLDARPTSPGASRSPSS